MLANLISKVVILNAIYTHSHLNLERNQDLSYGSLLNTPMSFPNFADGCNWLLNEHKNRIQSSETPTTICLLEFFGSAIVDYCKSCFDFLIARPPSEVAKFHKDISKRFKSRTFCPSESIHFNGLLLEQANGFSVRLSMSEYMINIQPIEISRWRKKHHADPAFAEELPKIFVLAGSLNFLDNGLNLFILDF